MLIKALTNPIYHYVKGFYHEHKNHTDDCDSILDGKQSLRAVLHTLIKMYTFAPNFKFGTK